MLSCIVEEQGNDVLVSEIPLMGYLPLSKTQKVIKNKLNFFKK
jgi:hypothetical protein